ncbi:MAG: hypothetical protein ACK5HR_03420 [Mycoplasmatales bacterium]
MKNLKQATLEDYSNYNERVNDLLFEIESFEAAMKDNIKKELVNNTSVILNSYFRKLLEVQTSWDGIIETANEYINEFYKIYGKMDFKVMKEEDIVNLNKSLLELINNVGNYKAFNFNDSINQAKLLMEDKDEDK